MADASHPRTSLAIALVGADALIAARPATPVQVLHGCLEVGFAAAYPATWGDELVARDCLRQLAERRSSRVIHCSCPFAAKRVEDANTPAERLTTAAPPVAAARLVRAAYADQPVRITYIGGCPSAIDEAIDAHVTPAAFLGTLYDHGIALSELPDAFDAVLPPDRRRYLSVPGGAPTDERLALEGWKRTCCVADADHAHERVLIDLAPASGCLCAGGEHGRRAVEALEPPRSQSPVVDPLITVDMRPTPAFTPPEWYPVAAKSVADIENPVLATDSPVPQPTVEDVAVAAAASEEEPTTENPELGEDPAAADVEAPPQDTPAQEALAQEASAEVFTEISEALHGEVMDGKVPDVESDWTPFEPRVRRWSPTPQVILPDVTTESPRRFSSVTIALALALGVTIPLAALGAVVLWRNGAGALRMAGRPEGMVSEVPAPPASVDSLARARERSLDSAAQVGASIQADTNSRRVDSAAGQTVAPATAARQPRTGGRASTEPGSQRASGLASPRERLRPSPVEARPSTGTEVSGAPTVPRSTIDSARGTPAVVTRDTSVDEAEALKRDIAVRRARADSLARVVDSLRRVRPKQMAKP